MVSWYVRDVKGRLKIFLVSDIQKAACYGLQPSSTVSAAYASASRSVN